MAAEQLGQILLNRTPNDPRVQYLMFVLRYRENRFDEAFGFLERAVRLEAADPIRDYSEFMEPIQGRSRALPRTGPQPRGRGRLDPTRR